MKIACFISSLGDGGAQRVLVTLCEQWRRDDHEVVLITLADRAMDMFSLPGSVTRVALSCVGASHSVWGAVIANGERVRKVRQALSQLGPDVVLSFLHETNCLVLAAAVGLGMPIVVSERIHPPEAESRGGWKIARWLLYRTASAVVVQTTRTREWVTAHCSPRRVCVIPNPVHQRFVLSLRDTAMCDRQEGLIVAMGRLTPQKGFDVLLKAFRRVVGDLPGWTLVVLGTGPDEGALRCLAEELGIDDRVEFVGWVEEPEAYLRRASIFVLPSRFEGFPCALIEAMSCGCAVVASDCSTGPREILSDGTDGLLVPPEDPSMLAETLFELARSPERRQALGTAALASVHRYDPRAIADKWLKLFQDVAER